MERTILHCDCNSFYASVECMLNPKLKDVPMAVGGDSASRHGIILAKNELAKKYNIMTAEPVAKAVAKCPNLVIVPPHHNLYEEISERVNAIYLEYTDLAEKFGIDETWLDVTGSKGLFGDGKQIAEILRERVKKEIGITISVGVSFNKIFAKLGSDYKKPDAVTVIPFENFEKFIFPLPVDMLLFVGKKTVETLKKMYINTIGELAVCDPIILKNKMGKIGEQLYVYANGLDREPVKSIYEKEQVKSVGKGLTFEKDITDIDGIRREIFLLSDYVSTGLRKHKAKCTVVQLHIKDTKFKVISRQKTLYNPTFVTDEIAEHAMELFMESGFIDKPVRSLTVTASNIVDENASDQLLLFSDNTNKDKLEHTVDELRAMYGKGIIMRGGNLK